MSKLSQLQKNILSGTLVHGLNISLVFISYPIYISFLGIEQFSVWILISIIISFAQFGDFGIGKAIINYTSFLFNSDNKKEILSIIVNGISIVIFISIIIQIIINLFLNTIINLLNIPPIYHNDAYKAIPLIGISIFTFLLYDTLANVIAGIGRIDKYNLLLLLLNILKTSLTIIFLYLNPNIISMVFGIIISNTLFLIIIITWLIKNKIIYLNNLKDVKIKLPIISKLIKYGLPVFGIQIVNIFMFPFIKIIISKIFGIQYVGYFELSTKSAYSIRTLFEKGLTALLPEYSKFANNNKNSIDQLKRLANSFTFKIIIYFLPVFSIIILLSKYFLKTWLQSNYNDNVFWGFLLLQPGIIISLISLPSYYALMGIRKHYHCFIESLIRLALTIILFYYFKSFIINYNIIFIFISIIVIISNTYVMAIFKRIN
ncbi:MAG: oligosaccharide flippase family protein [Bacteroidota bacterium]